MSNDTNPTLRLVESAANRAAWAERHFETAAATYVRQHLGTSIRAVEHEKQMLQALEAGMLEAQQVVRELAVTA